MNAPIGSVARQISGAAFWSYAAALCDRAIRFIVFVIVARIVTPTQFGVVAISLLIIEALQVFLDAGLGTALVRQDQPTELEFDSAFTFTVAMGLIMSVLFFVGADRLAQALRQPQAAPILKALAPVPLINAFGSIHAARLIRDVRFRKLAARAIISSALGSIVAVIMALSGWGLWALVVRTLVGVSTNTLGLWWATSWLPKFRLDWPALRSLLPTGLRLVGSSLIGQINARGFDLFAGAILGAAALATLRIAGQTVMLLIELTIGPLTYVGYAILTRHKDDPVRFREGFRFIAELAAALIFPAFLGLFAVSNQLFPLVFGPRWAGASLVVPFLCALCAPLYVQLLVSAALFAAGRSDRLLLWSLIECGLTIALAAIGSRLGLAGLAALATLRLYAMIPLGLRWLGRDAGLEPGLVIGPAAGCALAAVVMATAVTFAARFLQTIYPPIVTLAICVPLGALLYMAMLPIVARRLFEDLRQWVRPVRAI